MYYGCISSLNVLQLIFKTCSSYQFLSKYKFPAA